jgi:uncharacterized membrane protein YgdD (TMEM256/DUF423 family)
LRLVHAGRIVVTTIATKLVRLHMPIRRSCVGHATMRPGQGVHAGTVQEGRVKTNKTAIVLIIIGAMCAFLSVAAGAFGAHALKTVFDPARLAVYETAAKYQMYHALALVVVGWQAHQTADVRLMKAGWLFVAGIVLFSGSLYIVAAMNVRWAGAVTPIGGLAFLGGWAILAWTGWRRLNENG